MEIESPLSDQWESLWEHWDDFPTDEIEEENFDAWIADYRRRLLRTPFPGRTGNRNKSILLSMTTVMEQQRERIITITYPDLVRVCAADFKTVQKAIIALREAGHIRCLGCGQLVSVRKNDRQSRAYLYRFALMTGCLVPEEHAEAIPATLSRVATGDFAHDAFGGRRGIKRADCAMLRWLAEHPGATRYEAGKAGIMARATAYRVIDRLVQFGLVCMNEEGNCSIVDDRSEVGLLTNIVQENVLYGQTERRVDNAIYPFEEARRAIRRRENPSPGQAGRWGMPQ